MRWLFSYLRVLQPVPAEALTYKTLPEVRDLQSQPIFEIRGHQEKRMKVRSIAQHLESIRDSFGLRMSEIAGRFLRVSLSGRICVVGWRRTSAGSQRSHLETKQIRRRSQ